MITVKQTINLKSPTSNLFHVKHQALEVFTLRMIYIDRMIGRLMQLMEYAHLASCLCSSGKDGIAEIVLCNDLRTGEGEDDATWLYLFQCLHIETCIALQGIVKSSTVLGKGWGVENDDIVVACCLFEVLEGILAYRSMAWVIREIEVYVLCGEFDSPL